MLQVDVNEATCSLSRSLSYISWEFLRQLGYGGRSKKL